MISGMEMKEIRLRVMGKRALSLKQQQELLGEYDKKSALLTEIDEICDAAIRLIINKGLEDEWVKLRTSESPLVTPSGVSETGRRGGLEA